MMNRHRVIHAVGEGRAEISPVVKFIVDDEQIAALTAEYQRIASGGSPSLDEATDNQEADAS